MDTHATYTAMLAAMKDRRHVQASALSRLDFRVGWLGSDGRKHAGSCEFDRGVMLVTGCLEEYEDWESDDDEEAGGKQLELF